MSNIGCSICNKEINKPYINNYLINSITCMGYELGYNEPVLATSYFAIVIIPSNYLYYDNIVTTICNKSERTVDVVIGLYPVSRLIQFNQGTKSKLDLSELATKYGVTGCSHHFEFISDTDNFIKFLKNYYDLIDNRIIKYNSNKEINI